MGFAVTFDGGEEVPQAHVADIMGAVSGSAAEAVEGAELPLSALSPVGVAPLASEDFPTASSGGP